MDATLGLLGCGSSGVSSNGSAVSKVEPLDVGLSSEATSYPEEAELELGLGLSLGGGGARAKPSAWGECGRILTAKDFPSVLSHAVSGTKRAAESGPQEGSSPPRSSQVVGWPPIRAYRMNSLVNQAKTPRAEEDKAGDKKGNNLKDAIKIDLKAKERVGFVKVNMDGIGIGRKVDLNAHACYETLAQALEDMFFKPTTNITIGYKLLDVSSEFVLTYEDKEGDWMLVGDVPWRMFVNTVKRLRIMRTSEAKGLAPRVQDSNGRQRRKPV